MTEDKVLWFGLYTLCDQGAYWRTNSKKAYPFLTCMDTNISLGPHELNSLPYLHKCIWLCRHSSLPCVASFPGPPGNEAIPCEDLLCERIHWETLPLPHPIVHRQERSHYHGVGLAFVCVCVCVCVCACVRVHSVLGCVCVERGRGGGGGNQPQHRSLLHQLTDGYMIQVRLLLLYRPVAADVIIWRVRTGTPTWQLFCVLGNRSYAPTMLIVCVESNKMWLIWGY